MTIIDLSLPIDNDMPGVEITPARRLETDGWNATTLALYSHCGTHMDAPCHFVPGGNTLDKQSLETIVGEAIVLDLSPAEPKQLITVADVGPIADQVVAGVRILFRTDWHKRYGTPEYRHELPRISIELAEWLVERRVGLIGVEPPSVADVNNRQELTEVHQTLFRGGVVIVEGLANLDRIHTASVQFIALPLNITGGDGCPVRAIAIEAS